MLAFGVTYVIFQSMKDIQVLITHAMLKLILHHPCMDNDDIILTLPNLFFPLAQCAELQVGQPFGVIARFNFSCMFLSRKGAFDMVQIRAMTTLEGLCNVFVHEEHASPGFNDSVLPNPLAHFYIFPICSQSSSSFKY